MASTDYSQPHAHHASQSSSIGTATPPPNTKPYPVTSAPSKGTQPSPIQTHTIQPTATTQSPATPAKSTPFLLHEAQASKQQPCCHIHVQKNRGATSPSATDSKNITAQPAVKWPSYSSTPNHDTLHAQPFPSHAPREGVRLAALPLSAVRTRFQLAHPARGCDCAIVHAFTLNGKHISVRQPPRIRCIFR